MAQQKKKQMDAKILYSGVLMKKDEYNNTWHERWFVLFDNRVCGYYHNREEFQDSRRPIASINLKQVTAIQPVNTSMTPTPHKTKKKGFFRSNSANTEPKSNQRNGHMSRSQSMDPHISQNHNDSFTRSQSANADSPIPSMTNTSSGNNNSLRLSFKSLMGKKSNKKSQNTNHSPRHGNRLSVDSRMSDDLSEYSYSGASASGSDSNERGHQPRRSGSGSNLGIFQAEFPFEIVTPTRTYLLCCLDAYSFNDWLEYLRNVTFGKRIYGGWLNKQGKNNKSWRKRWFVIFDTREIRYYDNEKSKHEKGSIILDELQIMNLLEDKPAKSQYKKKNVFELVCGGRKWVLVAQTKEERELWFNRIVQVVPNVQRLDPLYSNELSYKRNDRAKKWMKGYFAMDVEYLFFFKNKESFEAFKASAYFQEELYTFALAQHVHGLIPLRNRKIKELERNHPACSGKNKFVFSLKTSAGEFFLSTQYSIQMDDWLDAFRELYRLELQEKRQGVISKRRKHSNSFSRRPPSPPSRSRQVAYNNRSISPTPSHTQYHKGGSNIDDEKGKRLRYKNRGIAEAGQLSKNKHSSHRDRPRTGSGGHYAMPTGMDLAEFQAKNTLKTGTNQSQAAAGHRRKRKPSAGRKRPTRGRNKRPSNSKDRDSDSPSPPPPRGATPIEPPPRGKPKGRTFTDITMQFRRETPFKELDAKIAQRRKSREKVFGDDAHYEIKTKQITGASPGVEPFTPPTLNEGNEGSSGDSDFDSKDDKEQDAVIDEWAKNNNEKKKGKRPKRKDKQRKPSVGQVLRSKIKIMRTGKKNKKKQKEKEKKKQKEMARKKKKDKKEKQKKKEDRARREKERKKKKKEREKREAKLKDVDVMKSLEDTKKEHDKRKNKGKKEKKTRRKSVGDVLREAVSGSKKKDDAKDKAKETAKKEAPKPSSGRKKRSEKSRRRSDGGVLRGPNDLDFADDLDEDFAQHLRTVSKKKGVQPPPMPIKAKTSTNGRKSRKDKTRRQSLNDVMKDVFGSKKKDEDNKKKEDTKKKKDEGNTSGAKKKKRKEKKTRRVSLGDAFFGRKNRKKKGDDNGSSSSDDTIGSSDSESDQKKKKKGKPPGISTQLQTNKSESKSKSSKKKQNKKTNKREKTSTPTRDSKRINRDKDVLVMKDQIKPKKKTSRHARHETPRYEVTSKEVLGVNSASDMLDDDESVSSGSVNTPSPNADRGSSEDDDVDVDSPKAPPKNFHSYRRKDSNITRTKDGGKRTPTGGGKTKGFRARVSKYDKKDTKDKPKETTGKNKSFTVKKISGKPTKTQSKPPQSTKRMNSVPAKINRSKDSKTKPTRNRARTRGSDSSKSSESDTQSETGSDSTGSSSESGSESEFESGSSEYSSDSGSEYETSSTGSETDSDYTDSSGSDSETDSDSDSDDDSDSNSDRGKLAKIIAEKKKWEKKKTKKETELDERKAKRLVRQEEMKKQKMEEEKKAKEARRLEAKQEGARLEKERKEKEAQRKKDKEKDKIQIKLGSIKTQTSEEEEPEEDEEDDDEDDEEDDYEDDEDYDDEDSDEDDEVDDYDDYDDDSLDDNSDDEHADMDAAMAAYVQLNSNDTAVLPEGDEHKEWERLQALKARAGHRRSSTALMKWNTTDLIAEENDDPTADGKELSKMWAKLQSIPKSSRRDTTETRIVKEFMMFQLNHDHSIEDDYIVIETMCYPNIYQWNGYFVGPQGTPYVNGKYRICIKFGRDYPSSPPKITFLTKIYNSSVKHNKRKKRGLLKLPKFFDCIWSKKISLRQWLNVVYEFLFYYCGDHFFDPMNQRVAREFIFAFDSFIDTCYQWNLIFANGYRNDLDMLELHDEYGERQKLTFYCAKFSNQYDFEQYKSLKEMIWQTIRDTYHASYESFSVLIDYFGNEFYYCGLSELIREPHVCVKHKVKQYDNIVKW